MIQEKSTERSIRYTPEILYNFKSKRVNFRTLRTPHSRNFSYNLSRKRNLHEVTQVMYFIVSVCMYFIVSVCGHPRANALRKCTN